ncbi:MAG: basic secretory family protein [Armatimonadetes bacterium]|nr:basic secretory family protein [Armatimonadota bacterium]
MPFSLRSLNNYLCLALLATGVPSAMAVEPPTPPPQTPATKSVDEKNPFQDPDLYVRNLYPLSKPLRTPKITLDVSDAPEVRPWALAAQKLAAQWYGHITQIMGTDNLKPQKEIKLIFKKGIGPPAYMSDGNITIKVEWIKEHPEDFGMVIHELVHVVQSYPRARPGASKPGWLVEGIADYIRWWRYEPEVPRTPINTERASYRDSYRTTAWFLAWITGKYNRSLTSQLDRALREGTYTDELFPKLTGGKTLDALWTEFIATLPPRR